MRTISWKHPVIALFAAAVVAACSSDSTPAAPAEAGTEAGTAKCGNGKVETGEDCDGTTTKTCSQATMGMKPTGTVSCTSKCKFDTSKCTGGGGTGGGGGGGAGGGGGTGGGPMGGGGAKADGGPDSGPATGGKAGSGGGKTDSGTTDSGKPDAAPMPVDAAKG